MNIKNILALVLAVTTGLQVQAMEQGNVHRGPIRIGNVTTHADGSVTITKAKGQSDADFQNSLKAVRVDGSPVVSGTQTAQEVTDENGLRLLHSAVVRNDISEIKRLLKLKVNPNNQYLTFRLPIFEAIENNSTEAAKLLIEAGVNVNIVNKDGDTPLKAAINFGNMEIISALIKSGATFKNGELAAAAGHFRPGLAEAMVKALLAAGANPDEYDKDNKRAIDYVYKDKGYDTVRDALKFHMKPQ